MRIGSREFDINHHTYIMGILNVTPDSFSDGGSYHTLDKALAHAEQMIKEGADIIDVGGESTRPGYTQISDDEEIQRVVPVIRAIKDRFDVPVSLDTYKSSVAKAGIREGADLLNDIWGLKYDDRMAKVIAESETACCLMHNRAGTEYGDFMKELLEDLEDSVRIGKEAGIPEDRIILDPGIGFGKTYEQNLEAINRLEELHRLGYPLLLGTSRKSVIGLTLHVPARERLAGTIATTVLAVQKGCAFVRVHDVKENREAVRMTEAVLGR